MLLTKVFLWIFGVIAFVGAVIIGEELLLGLGVFCCTLGFLLKKDSGTPQ